MNDDIFCISSATINGTLSANSEINSYTICDSCENRIPHFLSYKKVEYIFEEYSEEDIIMAKRAFFVSERLKNELLNNQQLKGMEFTKITNKKSKYCDKKTKIPDFYYINILSNKAECNSLIYTIKGVCKKCHSYIVEFKDDGLEIMTRSSEIHSQLKLEIKKSSWDESDIFYAKLHFEPIITRKFLGVLEKFNIGKLKLSPAVWI